MKASELRIGNFVFAEVGLPSLDIHQTVARDIVDIERGLQGIKPIPITDEWLEKFGFVKADNYRNPYESHFWNDGEVLLIQSDKLYCSDITSAIEIKHVHQLQNLYFALTGEELTIKE